jgi:hypothetical protein
MRPPLTFFMLLPVNDFDFFGSLLTFVRFEAVLVLDLVAISFFLLSFGNNGSRNRTLHLKHMSGKQCSALIGYSGFLPDLSTAMMPPFTFFMLLPDNDFDDFGRLFTFVRFEALLVLDLVAISFFSP